MATVRQLTSACEAFLLAPRPGAGVCRTCFNLTDGYSTCYACTRNETWIDAVAPISYSVALEQLHLALAGYKRARDDIAHEVRRVLAAVLWRYLARHEACLARAAGTAGFEIVATIPSSDRVRDEDHPLRAIVGTLVGPTRGRHERLLLRSAVRVEPHTFNANRFVATRALEGESVLLIDDTWTTGANAQSAAAALKRAGAGPTAVVVVGRHLNREWHENDRRLAQLRGRFDWERCARCSEVATPTSSGSPAIGSEHR
jgi:predicted amidophosphoribosyltransferase